ncbi:DUF924 family protein [Halopseudomonas oceani]|uniref:DUF924 family protein n=1 Tax=Halopseudomonas oceani TaxID=1708783 RepID=UPI002AA92BE0|nr:DUF924 family protein [Halopseudomonas oceani]
MHYAQLIALARYNQWMNQRLYALCETLEEADRRAPRGAFFGSIHGTLNHILLADNLWMGRFTDQPFSAPALDTELYAGFAELRRAREMMDERIIEWVGTLSPARLAGELRYTSLVNPEPRCYPLWLALTHFFNHQTHHRGQLTTLLSQLGTDPGVTDLIQMPGIASASEVIDQETVMSAADEVLAFWFAELRPAQWWQKDPALDELIRSRFGDLHERAVRGELMNWRGTALGRLAEIIVLDQFSRNIWRDTPRAFAADGMALVLAQEAVTEGADQPLPVKWRAFLYMPFMHSESLRMHEQATKLFSTPGLEDNLRFEQRHREIIERFGRYPHRNAILGRPSTAEEVAFLRTKGSAF